MMAMCGARESGAEMRLVIVERRYFMCSASSLRRRSELTVKLHFFGAASPMNSFHNNVSEKAVPVPPSGDLHISATREKLNRKDIDAVFQILANATNRTRAKKPKGRLEVMAEKISKIAMVLGLAGFLLLISLAVLSVWEKFDWIYPTALGISVIVNLCALVLLMESIVSSTPGVFRIIKRPFNSLLERMQEAAINEAMYVEELTAYKVEVLEYALIHYKAERGAFERRSANISGTMEKVGIVPALLAYAVVASSLLKDAGQLVKILVWTAPAFYCLAFFAGLLSQKMDRVAALLEYSIKLKTTAKK